MVSPPLPRPCVRWLARLWALPWTVVGLVIGLCSLLTGGRMRIVSGVVEFSGGLVTLLLRRFFRAAAMTLGHVILGDSPETLDRAREHEHVHVRQYERWGLLFIPAYLACSLWLKLRGRRAYWDNPFEREAYDTCRIASTDFHQKPEA